MTLTRATTEKVLINRCRGLLEAAGLDSSTHDGTNDDFNDPIGFALRSLGYSVSDPADVTDADLVSVPSGEYNDFFDLSEYRTLETILGNLDDVDLRLGPRAENFSQLASQLEKRITRLSKKLEPILRVGAGGAFSAGWVRQDGYLEELTGEIYGPTTET